MSATDARSLAERLGHDADARLVIISCDDLGSCHAANEGVFDAIRHGVATCATAVTGILNMFILAHVFGGAEFDKDAPLRQVGFYIDGLLQG